MRRFSAGRPAPRPGREPRHEDRPAGQARTWSGGVRMTTFAALGDSITLGLGDPLPGGAWRGWAALLSESLREPELHNLAVPGARSADVERDQLPRALELRPDVASVVMGINDTLRARFDPVRIEQAAAHTVGSLRAAGAVVLTMRLPEPGQMLGLPGSLARPLARRMALLNAVMGGVEAADLPRPRVARGPAPPEWARPPADRVLLLRQARPRWPSGRRPARRR